ncbi:MAG: succinate dehydrogenase, hydrophobic membrane anchor protein [Alphaproteobacteria bacterium]|jgi:succinate dehydrogenase / fumarate reductase, membrane anchor subunit|nr:succinate dehydrogenase, hydrophobic membrane anchor protein [Alphaproteobacteria bacterium]MBT5389886.1 succinate dehydrogenase, hydrophobic membrane anchor protein [Alphaproteobacteria bacterium]MBT5540757.1 succinate dehydrogenase, hydrophobic membrane anchor protein [Alphaproteobacteria bacterium]MBT5654268.1 succinate dehydrogenase, hydrophobic membrane anchor protein [Alphaproteobacteria bacterium]
MNKKITRNLGPAASKHWLWQRITAFVLIPLSLWFFVSLFFHGQDSYQDFISWSSTTLVALGLLLFLIVAVAHTQMGLQEIIEDYIHGSRLKKGLLLMVKISLWGLLVLAAVSLIRIALTQ